MSITTDSTTNDTMKRLRTVTVVFLISVLLIFLASVYNYRSDINNMQISPGVATTRDNQEYNNTSDKKPMISDDEDGLPEYARIPNDAVLAKLDETTLLKIYWKYINMLQVLCKDIIRVGSMKDGGKEICIDGRYKPQAPCLVYSFGINHLFDFDIAMVEDFGCDVHCFDPSMKNETRRLSEHIWFYRMGLGGRNEINSKQWDIKTLDTIRRELGHTNRTIDLLKIDIEGDEWHAIPQMITTGSLNDVRQISMETHFSAEHANKRDFWGNLAPHKQLSALRQLYDFGYRTFMRERNMWSHAMWHGIKGFITNVNEISMIKPGE